MPDNETGLVERKERAFERYHHLFAWYERSRARSKVLFYLFQALVISLSGVTPILILLTNSKPLQAIPAAIASVLAGLMSVFRFHDIWVRRATASQALSSERVKFETRSGDQYGNHLDESEVLERFVLRVEAIAADEVSQWRQKRSATTASTSRTRRG